MHNFTRIFALFLPLLLVSFSPLLAQDQAETYQIVVTPESASLNIDDTVQFKAVVQDTDGNTVQDSVFFYSRNRKGVSITRLGLAKALQAGSFEINKDGIFKHVWSISWTASSRKRIHRGCG